MCVSVKPYYEHAGITIYHGDCRAVPDVLSTGILVTDPPYGTGAYETDTAPPIDLFKQGRAAVFGYPQTLLDWMLVFGKPKEWLVWWPSNGALRGSFLSPHISRETEHIALWGAIRGTLRMPKVREDLVIKLDHEIDRKCPDVWRDAAPGLGFHSANRLHKNEKPLTVMQKLLTLLGCVDETVLDPFMGSGTTLVAAKNLGHRAIGIEIEERYCEIAAKRLQQDMLQFGTVQ